MAGLNRRIAITLTLFFLGASALAYYTETTFDDGDSIMHYLIARYAFAHPYLLLDHWGKPVFTLLAAPFAAGGLTGIKMFNCMVAAAAALFTCLSAKKAGFKIPILAIAFIYSAPLFLLSQFSGLTEPLFALFMIAAFLLLIYEQRVAAAVVISFLPFVRSEGLVIILVYAAYWLLEKRWKMLPWLLFGNVVYGLIGALVRGDFLWAFHENPYQGVEVKYGRGDNWLHYIEQLYYVIGLPLFVLFCIGLIFYAIDAVRKIRDKQYQPDPYTFILCGCSLAFIAAHTIFWNLGLFHSYGLNRVLICIIPYVILIGLYGLERTAFRMLNQDNLQFIIAALVLVLVMLFPYSRNKSGLVAGESFALHPRQKVIKEASAWLLKDGRPKSLYVGAPYWYETLDLDPFDSSICRPARELKNGLAKRGSLVLWDNYFTETDQGIPPETFSDSSRFMLLYSRRSGPEEKAEAKIYLAW